MKWAAKLGIGIALIAILTLIACRDVGRETYYVPPQVPPAEALPARATFPSRVILDDEASLRQVSGFHPIQPNWSEGRWMRENAEVYLSYDPGKHTRLVIRGSCDPDHLKQTGPIHLVVESGGKDVLTGVVREAGPFVLEAKLPAHWKSAPEDVTLGLRASPSWTGDGWTERFTLTVIEIGFEGDACRQ